MRLLNVHTLQFRDFYGVPEPYIVTSHRWSAGNEAMLEDVKHGRRTNTSGFKKIEGFAKFARENFSHVDWLWIDTCCVNQESDREVSEAVNSMFRWYSQAELCLAYLADVSDSKDMDQFGRSEWFRRGWTLQELLAPHSVLFLSQGWEVIGRKGSQPTNTGFQLNNVQSLESAIATITTIPKCVLDDYATSKDYSIDVRLAWMTGRETTREEDMIYSLFGIFDVTLSVIYGETLKRAKRRLLKEISDISSPPALNQNPSQDNAQPGLVAPPPQAPNMDQSSTEATQERTNLLTTATHDENDVEDNEDDLLTHEFAEAALAKGNDAFEHEDYYTADSEYKEVLELIRKLSRDPRQASRYDRPMIDFRLAACAFYIGDSLVAESALSAVIQDAKCQPINLCEASHMLSQVLIVTGKLDHATMSCQNNYYERRKLLGKDNMKCYESLALLSRIHKLTGNDREAIRYISIIPDEIQGSACQSFSTLWPPVERQWSDFKKLYVPVIRLQLQLRYRPSAVFSHDSRLLVCTAGDTYGVQIWDVASGAKRMDLHGSNNELLDIAISRDCEFVAAVNMERVVLLWDVMANDAPTRCRAHTADTGFYPESVAFSFDGKVLVLDWNPSLKQRAVTDILSGHNLITIPKQDGPSGRCATPLVFPNGKWLASTATNGTVTLWNLASYKLAQKLDGQYEITTQMSVSANGRRLALLSGNTSVRLWDIARGTVIKRLELGAPGTSIVFSAHLDLLAHGPHREDQTTLRVIESGSEVSLPGSFVAFSPDNQVVVVMNNVGNTALWQIESLRSHPGSQGQKPRPEAHALKAAKAAIPKQEQARSRHNVSPSKFTISNLFKRKST